MGLPLLNVRPLFSRQHIRKWRSWQRASHVSVVRVATILHRAWEGFTVHEIATGMGLQVQMVRPRERQSCDLKREGFELFHQSQATAKHVVVVLWDRVARKAIAASTGRNSPTDVRFAFVNEH